MAAIYKKDDPSLAGNYRPIALLCTLYKLYARLIQHRLADRLDSKLRNRQYGFRRNKSGSDPIHIVRRLQELYEVSRSPLYMLFLDWKNAFDKLTFAGLRNAITRLGVPPHMVEVVMSLYNGPTFSGQGGQLQILHLPAKQRRPAGVPSLSIPLYTLHGHPHA